MVNKNPSIPDQENSNKAPVINDDDGYSIGTQVALMALEEKPETVESAAAKKKRKKKEKEKEKKAASAAAGSTPVIETAKTSKPTKNDSKTKGVGKKVTKLVRERQEELTRRKEAEEKRKKEEEENLRKEEEERIRLDELERLAVEAKRRKKEKEKEKLLKKKQREQEQRLEEIRRQLCNPGEICILLLVCTSLCLNLCNYLIPFFFC
jgi:hypothetical protein